MELFFNKETFVLQIIDVALLKQCGRHLDHVCQSPQRNLFKAACKEESLFLLVSYCILHEQKETVTAE